MATDSRSIAVPAPLVAISAWLLPGSGYLLIGQRGRGLCIGITIIVLFISGLLIAGVRVIEVPGFNVDSGEKQMTTPLVQVMDPSTHTEVVVPMREPLLDPATHQPVLDYNGKPKMVIQRRWVLGVSMLGEIRDKPWSVPQVLAGPIAILGGTGSVYAAAHDPATMKIDPETAKPDPKTGTAYGAITHARINEIGSLYLSVAGLLNLMAIIDCTWRASQLSENRRAF